MAAFVPPLSHLMIGRINLVALVDLDVYDDCKFKHLIVNWTQKIGRDLQQCLGLYSSLTHQPLEFLYQFLKGFSF